MYNVLLKVKTRLVYTLSGVITPYASGISTPSSEVVTPQSPHDHVYAYNRKKTPEETQKTFLECSVIRMMYDMPMCSR